MAAAGHTHYPPRLVGPALSQQESRQSVSLTAMATFGSRAYNAPFSPISEDAFVRGTVPAQALSSLSRKCEKNSMTLLQLLRRLLTANSGFVTKRSPCRWKTLCWRTRGSGCAAAVGRGKAALASNCSQVRTRQLCMWNRSMRAQAR